MPPRGEVRIGVVLEAFLDQPLEAVLAWLREAAPEITDIEVGAGGYAPHPHCDVAALLASAHARAGWLDTIARHGLRLDALNAWGNPLHPDADIARQHDEDLRNAIRLAPRLGADRVVAMAGCPAGAPGDQVPHFGAGGWLPYLEDVYQRQWEQRIGPYWSGLAEFAAAEQPDLRVCLELHPGTSVFNVETFRRVAALGPSISANLDPSHFFWMGMDGHRVSCGAGRPGRSRTRQATPSSTPTAWRSTACSTGGGPEPAGRDAVDVRRPLAGGTRWTGGLGLIQALSGSEVQVISIEHEDLVRAWPRPACRRQGAALLRTAIDTRQDGAEQDGLRFYHQPARRLRVGLIGTGLIAQVMHLHYLTELADRFEIAAVCDIVAAAMPKRALSGTASPLSSPTGRTCSGHPLDAVLVLTSGSRRTDRGGRGAGRAARVHREADVLLGGGRTRDGRRSRAGRGDPDGRLPEALRPGLRPLRTGGRRIDRCPADAGNHVRVAATPLRRALPPAHAGAAARRRRRAAPGGHRRPHRDRPRSGRHRAGAVRLPDGPARHAGARTEHDPWRARRARPAGLRKPGQGHRHRATPIRRTSQSRCTGSTCQASRVM